jgi:hypothetical protein
MVAHLPGRERSTARRTPRAHTPTLIGYTTSWDAIESDGGWVETALFQGLLDCTWLTVCRC